MELVGLPLMLYAMVMTMANSKAPTISARPLTPAPTGRMGQTWVREEKCRAALEEKYGVPFPKCRQFVKSPLTGRYLELDGYSSQLGIAFEHNGIQHDTYPNAFHRTLQQFRRQVYNDRIKAKECERRGIRLVVIRQDEDIGESIRRQL